MSLDEMSEKRFDKQDLNILRVLLADSRKSLQQIGQEVGLSTTSCWNRIKRMEGAGAIQGYTVKVDLSQLGYRDSVIVQVNLESHSDETLYEFGRMLETISLIQRGMSLKRCP